MNAARLGAAAAVICVIAFAPGASRAAASVPDIKDLVRRYGLAMHYDKIANLRSVTRTSSGFMGNRVVTYTTMAKAPDKMLEIITVDGADARISIGFDGTTAWAQGPSGAVAVLDGAASRFVEGMAFGLVGDPRTMNATAGATTIHGVDFYVISVRDASGFGRDIMVDEKTYLPIYWRVVVGNWSHLFDVGPLDEGPLGELYPRTIQTINSDGSIGTPASVTSVDDNISLPDSMFAPPGQ
ncbi:MAG TPA: hypothetical protein VFO25_00715 [Candidatus Eremiobacteraceae bacterium]|nr:hypothetical protein [Candidatus Eremiobacteraceae bacterium]